MKTTCLYTENMLVLPVLSIVLYNINIKHGLHVCWQGGDADLQSGALRLPAELRQVRLQQGGQGQGAGQGKQEKVYINI